jgi:hypothetical protein
MRIPVTYYINVNFKKRKNGKIWKSTDSRPELEIDRVIAFLNNRYANLIVEKEFDFNGDYDTEDYYNIRLLFKDKADEADFIIQTSE